MEKQEELKRIISEVEKDLSYLEKSLDKKDRNSFESKRTVIIDKLKKIEENLK